MFFTGEFDRVLVDVNGKPGSSDYNVGDDIVIDAKTLELSQGKRGVTELDRLSYFVNAVEREC